MRSQTIIIGMWTLAIVFSINKLVDTMGKLFHRLEFPQIKVLIFQCVVETFHGSIVVRTASSTHALLHVVLHADIGEFFRGKLGSLVAMKNQSSRRPMTF